MATRGVDAREGAAVHASEGPAHGDEVALGDQLVDDDLIGRKSRLCLIDVLGERVIADVSSDELESWSSR